ncbi:sigma-70 family RNA polymerase sigma factor [Novosphingobium sp. 17-62-19]|uniref:RNA polymerase sigma factor n=1 Tax=Novosphingobium sp. 17-62-19 TaxID=1970406 RepID=UPI0025D56EB9|nr:sigma-70 family RNA polymerase sigma factor [Novosphingobium sp. 17-62-19]
MMHDTREIITAWVAREVLPHEPTVRRWAVRRWGVSIDVDDVIQEVYCRIAALKSVEHIHNGRAYFFTSARAVVMDSMRRARIANTKSMTEIDCFDVEDDAPLADRRVEAIQELARVNTMLSELSPICRNIIALRRIHGLSQKETARHLGVTESVVENHIARGIRRLMDAVADQNRRGENVR